MLALSTLAAAATTHAHHLGEQPGFEEKLRAADHDSDRGRYAEAIVGFRAALALAKREDNVVYVRFRAALALRRTGKAAEARAELFTLVRLFPRHDKAPRALYVAARILETDLADKPGAEKEQLVLLRRFRRSDVAARALFRVATLRAERNFDDAIAFLRDTYRHTRKGPLGPRALYLAAQLFQEHLNSAQAIRLYEQLAKRFPKSGLRDDALWHAAALHREGGRPERAIKLLRRLTGTRKDSWAFGSYNSIYLDKAALLVAKIQREDLKDLQAAADTLQRFIEDFPHTFLRPEGRGLHIETLVALGRRDDARKAFLELEKLFPQSRFTRRARALLGAATPPTPAAPNGVNSPNATTDPNAAVSPDAGKRPKAASNPDPALPSKQSPGINTDFGPNAASGPDAAPTGAAPAAAGTTHR